MIFNHQRDQILQVMKYLKIELMENSNFYAKNFPTGGEGGQVFWKGEAADPKAGGSIYREGLVPTVKKLRAIALQKEYL